MCYKHSMKTPKKSVEGKVTLDKLAQAIGAGFTSVRADIREIRSDIREVRTDLTKHDEKFDELTDILNTHTIKLNNLASKHDLESMLEKSWSLALLKSEHELMKKYMREKLHVEI